MRKFIREYRVELIALLILFLAIFLLTEKMYIRQTVWGWLAAAFDFLGQSASNLAEALQAQITDLTVSDLIGILLLFFTLLFILWRARYRFLRSSFWQIRSCPRCGSPVKRIRRKMAERVFSRLLFLHAHRYLCSNPDCRWTGLRGSSDRGLHRRKAPMEEEILDQAEN